VRELAYFGAVGEGTVPGIDEDGAVANPHQQAGQRQFQIALAVEAEMGLPLFAWSVTKDTGWVHLQDGPVGDRLQGQRPESQGLNRLSRRRHGLGTVHEPTMWHRTGTA